MINKVGAVMPIDSEFEYEPVNPGLWWTGSVPLRLRRRPGPQTASPDNRILSDTSDGQPISGDISESSPAVAPPSGFGQSLSFSEPFSAPSANSFATQFATQVEGSLPRISAAAMGMQAWKPPIFPGDWPVRPSNELSATSWQSVAPPVAHLLPGQAGLLPHAPLGENSPYTSGQLPSPSSAMRPIWPEVPISGGGDVRKNLAQDSASTQSVRDWRLKLNEALSDDNVRYYLGPHLSDALSRLAALAKVALPGSGTVQSVQDAEKAQQELNEGDYRQAVADYAAGILDAGLDWIPGAKVASFLGMAARTFPWPKFYAAIRMENAGISAGNMWHQTGMFRDVDGKWRFEVPDNEMRVTGSGWGVNGSRSGIQHPPLAKAHPEFKNVYYAPFPDPEPSGIYQAAPSGIPRSRSRSESAVINVRAPNSEWDTKIPELTVHELAHPLQDFNDFARYGTPRNAYDPAQLGVAKELYDRAAELERIGRRSEAEAIRQQADGVVIGSTNYDTYYRLAGEVEARNAAKRLRMTPEERRANLPWIDPEVPPDKQIVRFVVPPELPAGADQPGFRLPEDFLAQLRRLGLL